jgi:hypothetical protein
MGDYVSYSITLSIVMLVIDSPLKLDSGLVKWILASA